MLIIFFNTKNTVYFIEAKFYGDNQELFLSLFHKDDFSARQAVVLASQRLLLLEESSPCLRRAQWSFLPNPPSASRQTLLVKRGYHYPAQKQRLLPTGHFSSRNRNRTDQTLDSRWCPYLVQLQLRALRLSSPWSLLDWGYLELALVGCSKCLVSETTTSSKPPEDFSKNLLCLHGRHLWLSE